MGFGVKNRHTVLLHVERRESLKVVFHRCFRGQCFPRNPDSMERPFRPQEHRTDRGAHDRTHCQTILAAEYSARKIFPRFPGRPYRKGRCWVYVPKPQLGRSRDEKILSPDEKYPHCADLPPLKQHCPCSRDEVRSRFWSVGKQGHKTAGYPVSIPQAFVRSVCFKAVDRKC